MSFLLTLPCLLFSMFTTACRFAICMIPPRRLFFNRNKHQYYLPLSIECHHLHRTLSYNQWILSVIAFHSDPCSFRFVLHTNLISLLLLAMLTIHDHFPSWSSRRENRPSVERWYNVLDQHRMISVVIWKCSNESTIRVISILVQFVIFIPCFDIKCIP